jgi:CelD/BcsL family acetyltransferase involved in cellulose biosynthesis
MDAPALAHIEKSSGLRIVRQLDHATWKGFVEEQSGGNVFHTPEMFRAFFRTEGYHPNLWAAVDAETRPMALFLPVEISLVRGPLRYLTTRAVAYGSVLCRPDDRGRGALAVLLQRYTQEVKRSTMFTEMRNMSNMQAVQRVLVNRGFAFQEHLNFLIDLTRPTEEIWAGIRSNARRNIRKAERLKVHVREAKDIADIDTAYGVLLDAYKRLRVPLPPVSLFRATFEILGPLGMMRVLLAAVDGATVGALTLLLHKGVALYWYTGMLRQYSAYRPADLLVWRSLELARDLGFEIFDFGGGGTPREGYGVRDFKAKFGGDLVNFGRNTRVHAPIRFKLGQAGYRAWRRVP